jgi:hypothetical protein
MVFSNSLPSRLPAICGIWQTRFWACGLLAGRLRVQYPYHSTNGLQKPASDPAASRRCGFNRQSTRKVAGYLRVRRARRCSTQTPLSPSLTPVLGAQLSCCPRARAHSSCSTLPRVHRHALPRLSPCPAELRRALPRLSPCSAVLCLSSRRAPAEIRRSLPRLSPCSAVLCLASRFASPCPASPFAVLWLGLPRLSLSSTLPSVVLHLSRTCLFSCSAVLCIASCRDPPFSATHFIVLCIVPCRAPRCSVSPSAVTSRASPRHLSSPDG